jgi:hypothetical protein
MQHRATRPSLSSTRVTCIGVHFPPRVVPIPAPSSAPAISESVFPAA